MNEEEEKYAKYKHEPGTKIIEDHHDYLRTRVCAI
jgi:hypothetical protein